MPLSDIRTTDGFRASVLIVDVSALQLVDRHLARAYRYYLLADQRAHLNFASLSEGSLFRICQQNAEASRLVRRNVS